jgi:rubredoxin
MNCPVCRTEMEAVGGVPTTWQCPVCTAEKALEHSRYPEVRFVGDTLDTLERVK